MLVGGAVDAQINPYNDVGTQKELVADSVIPEAKKTRILADTTKPKVTMEKFGGEIALGVSYEKIKAQGNRPLFSKNMEWKQGNETMEMVPMDATTTMEDGGMEINIHLSAKPTSNVFSFTLDNWQNLDFFYQPELSPEEVAEGVSRPENIVGSYAVYYKDHANHIIGQTNYATGKAYHIFRPKVTDADGNEVWAEMHYESGTLTVTVPQWFLDTATYPVIVDPTFGYTSLGGTATSNGNTVDLNRLVSAVSSESGVITAFSYGASISSGSDVFRVGIYASTTGALLSPQSDEGTINSVTSQFWTVPVTGTLSINAFEYIIASYTNDDSDAGDIVSSYFDTGTAKLSGTAVLTGLTYPTWGDPLGTKTGTASRIYSIYATYTASAASTGATIYGATLQGATIY